MAENLPEALSVDQKEIYLSVMGYEVVKAKEHFVFASLFTDRAMPYRHVRGFAHSLAQLCVTCQKMVPSETDAADVMFTLDTERCFCDVVFVISVYGFGETEVGSTVSPDVRNVFKPTLLVDVAQLVRVRLLLHHGFASQSRLLQRH